MKQHLAPRDLALLLAVVALWGFSFVPIKVGLREVPPFALAALRFLFAAIPLVFFVRRPRMPAGVVIAYGLAIGVFQFGLLFLGMKLGMPAGLSSIVIQVQVFFTIGLGIVFLGDRLRGENIAGAAIAALGVLLLAIYKVQGGLSTTLAGLLIVLVAAFAWAIGNIVAKRAAGEHDDDMFALVVWSSLVPPLPLAVAAYAFEGRARSSIGQRAHLGLRAVHGLCRDAVRLRVVGAAAPPLSDSTGVAVRAADSGVGCCERRAVPRRIACADAGTRRGARVRGSRRERLRPAAAPGAPVHLLRRLDVEVRAVVRLDIARLARRHRFVNRLDVVAVVLG